MKSLLERVHGWCNRHEWQILLVGLVVLLRIPTLFTPHYYGDEEIYFVMGRAWSEGVPMYQAMFDHKPPLIYVLAGLAQNIFWFRAMLMLTMAVHTVVFYKIAAYIFDKQGSRLKYLASLIFVVLTTIPTFEGNIANAELFMMLPISAALLLLSPALDRRKDGKAGYMQLPATRYLLAGLVAGIGWLFKIPVVFDFMAFALFIFVFQGQTLGKSLKGILNSRFWLLSAGFVLPLAASFAYYYLKGHGAAYLSTVFTINLGYVSSWSTSKFEFNPWQSGLMSRAIVLGFFTLIIYSLRHRVNPKLQLVSLWVLFSFFGALLSGRPYPHYLLQPFVPLSLLIPFIFVTEKWLEWLLIGAMAMWAIQANSQIKFWAYDTFSLYSNFGKAITGKMTKQEYLESFDGARRNYKVAEYLTDRLRDQDKIFVWGSDMAIYNLTKTLPSGGKYMVNFHIHDFGAENYVMEELERNQPRFVVVLPSATEFPDLYALIDREFVQTYEVEGAKVYLRTTN